MTNSIDPRAVEAAKRAVEFALDDYEIKKILSAAQPFMVREGLTQDRLDKLSDDIAEAVQWWQIKGPKDREWKGIMEFVQGVIDKIPATSPPPSADSTSFCGEIVDAAGLAPCEEPNCAPSADEVERHNELTRLAHSLHHLNVCEDECNGRCLVCPQEVANRAADVIAAMNCAPQQDINEAAIDGFICGLNRAWNAVRAFKETHSKDLEFALTQIEKAIEAQMSEPRHNAAKADLCAPQRSYEDAILRAAEIVGYLLEADEISRANIEEAKHTIELELVEK